MCRPSRRGSTAAAALQRYNRRRNTSSRSFTQCRLSSLGFIWLAFTSVSNIPEHFLHDRVLARVPPPPLRVPPPRRSGREGSTAKVPRTASSPLSGAAHVSCRDFVVMLYCVLLNTCRLDTSTCRLAPGTTWYVNRKRLPLKLITPHLCRNDTNYTALCFALLLRALQSTKRRGRRRRRRERRRRSRRGSRAKRRRREMRKRLQDESANLSAATPSGAPSFRA